MGPPSLAFFHHTEAPRRSENDTALCVTQSPRTARRSSQEDGVERSDGHAEDSAKKDIEPAVSLHGGYHSMPRMPPVAIEMSTVGQRQLQES